MLFTNGIAAAKSLQLCPTVGPHRQQPTRLSHPWDSPGKNTGVGFHFLLQCMKVKSESEAAQSCLTLSYPMDCSLSGTSIHGILQARVPIKASISHSVHFCALFYSSLYFHLNVLFMWVLSLQVNYKFPTRRTHIWLPVLYCGDQQVTAPKTLLN